jgi:hypothetical protein
VFYQLGSYKRGLLETLHYINAKTNDTAIKKNAESISCTHMKSLQGLLSVKKKAKYNMIVCMCENTFVYTPGCICTENFRKDIQESLVSSYF